MIFLPSPKDRAILFLDMNSYFASVEQQANPSLRGRPIGVTPIDKPSGCVIAASYEAKKFGVRTGDSVSEARQKCPWIKIVISHPEKYLSVNKVIMKKLEKYSWRLNVMSIDEAYIELDSSITSKDAFDMARAIKKDILSFGDWLKCSIGIAPNVFLAKTAAEIEKPDGLTELKLIDLPWYFASLKQLKEITGIKKGMSKRLWKIGVSTPLDFFNAPAQTLRRGIGIMGEYWWLSLHGYRVADSMHEHPIKDKTFGHQHVLAPEFRDQKKAVSVLRKLVEKTARRIRNHNLWAGGVQLVICYEEKGYFEESKRVPPFRDSFSFWSHINSLFSSQPLPQNPIQFLSVRTFNLISAPEQISLFESHEKKRKISETIDSINESYGDFVLQPANMYGISDSAPTRIPFGPICS